MKEHRPKKKKKKSYCMISGKVVHSNKKQFCRDLGMWGYGREEDEKRNYKGTEGNLEE